MRNKIGNKKINPSILAGIIMILILVCSFVLFYEANNYRNIKTEESEFYYYFLIDKINFTGTIKKDFEDSIVDLEVSNVSIGNIPIYYEYDDSQMILPANMEIVYPYRSKPMYKIGKLSTIYFKKGNYFIKAKDNTGRLYDCFLFDGEDIYVFVDDTILIVDGKKYELSPMSFVDATTGYVRIFNKETGEYAFIENYNGQIEAYTDNYMINLSNDTFTYGNSFYILIKNVDGLDYVEF